MALKYWGKTISDYSAMRGPCPKGFHIPKSSERSAVVNAWVSLWARTTSWTTSVTNFRTYLKLPNIVYLFPGNWLPWTWWTPQHRYYWWCRQTWNDWSWRYCDALDVVEDYWWSIRVDNTSSNHWCPVRPFKDKPVAPDNSWTALYQSPGNTSWIYHNATLWLISISSDWTTWITIADKNAGATVVYNFWDTITSANWWWLYQWWNNYPFPIDWATTTSSTRVDTTWYGPWNYYSGSTFITGGANDDWFSPRNRDLWWWITWIQQKPVDIVERYYWGKTINDYSAMRWPCPSGYHIATISEWQSLMWTWSHLWAWNINWRWDDVKLYLRIPFAWIRFPQNWDTTYNGTNWQWYSANLWTSTGPSTSDDTARSFQITASSVRLDAISVRSAGYSVRPFKDVPVAPDSSWTTLYDWSSVAIWAWIFHNSTLWLISISWDWTTWTTIADKNLWATIIYSNWDTLSQANCGNFYQWWNCYWFPFSWNVTTSWTQVDASTYWPRNYYTSSTFITRNSGSSDWSSVKNDNLWWWVTWIQQRIAEVKEVYYNTTKIWPAYPVWVYWNQSLWLISASSNWTDWVTITDKNLWATAVYNQWDTMNESNCWKFYQRWNNYWFSFTWTPSRTSTKVNVSSYWPNNYYSSSTFVRVNWEWRWWTDASSTTALNLRWDITNTNEARRWPCPEWFHIPSHTEGQVLMDIPRTLQRLTWDAKRAVYKIPKCWFRDNYTAQVVDTWSDWAAWTTTQEATNFWWTMPSAWFWPAWWLNIRPFRNEPVIPTDEWTKLL